MRDARSEDRLEGAVTHIAKALRERYIYFTAGVNLALDAEWAFPVVALFVVRSASKNIVSTVLVFKVVNANS